MLKQNWQELLLRGLHAVSWLFIGALLATIGIEVAVEVLTGGQPHLCGPITDKIWLICDQGSLNPSLVVGLGIAASLAFLSNGALTKSQELETSPLGKLLRLIGWITALVALSLGLAIVSYIGLVAFIGLVAVAAWLIRAILIM